MSQGKENIQVQPGLHLSPQVAGVISSLVILVTILKIGELFHDLPTVQPVPQPPCHFPVLHIQYQGSTGGDALFGVGSDWRQPWMLGTAKCPPKMCPWHLHGCRLLL